MSDTMDAQCGSCKFYIPEPKAEGKIGTCRRFPPQRGWQIQLSETSKIGEVQLMQVPDSEFPLTSPGLWCGEYAASGIGMLEGEA